MSIGITAAVIVRDEERHLPKCLATIQWADELIVLDALSQDRTVEIARQYTDRVFQRQFTNFSEQRNEAIAMARGEWILFVDADERVTPELADEIRGSTMKSEYAGYWIPRRNYILGKWIRHAGWWPDEQLRLFRRQRAHYDPEREVHESVILDGPSGHLLAPLIHYNYDRLGQLFAKQDQYATHEARNLKRSGIKARPHHFILQPLREFIRRFVTLQGYRDGAHGFLLSLILAIYTAVAYRRLSRMG